MQIQTVIRSLILGFVFCGALTAQAAEVSCYNDDSQDVINQDELRGPIWGGPAQIPSPADCVNAPATAITEYGVVIVDGQAVYDGRFDSAVDVRVTPTGVVAIKTARGSLYVYNKATNSLSVWLKAHVRAVADYRLARDGSIIARGMGGEPLIDGRVLSNINTVQSLYASASNRLVALLSDGSVVDARGTLYRENTQPAVRVKVAADGTVVWLTESGRLGSTKSKAIYDGLDAVVSFKVNPSGQVAYVTQNGRLGRDGKKLQTGSDTIVDYKIYANGHLSAQDAAGRTYYFQ